MSGEVPEEWISHRLGDIVKIVNEGISADAISELAAVAHYSLPAFDDGPSPEITAGVNIKSNKSLIPPDCVLFSKLNPRIPRIWRVAERSHLPSICSTEFWPLIARNDDVDLDFLAAFIGSQQFLGDPQITPSSSTNSHQRVDRRSFENYVLLLPPLDEQRRIAGVLRSVDEAIAREIEVKVAAEASLDHALAAIIPGPETIEQGWTTTTIGEFATVITGKTPSTKDADLWGGDMPFVTPTDMDGSVRSVRAARSITQAAMKQTKVAPANSVLFTCIASIGKICLNREPVAFNQQINACACRDATDAMFLYWTLRRLTPQIRAMSGTTAVPIVNKTAFSRVSFALPPPASRREVIEVLSSISEVIESAQRTISSLTELKRRISSDLLSGRVRVPA